jgi:hypothetical protein
MPCHPTPGRTPTPVPTTTPIASMKLCKPTPMYKHHAFNERVLEDDVIEVEATPWALLRVGYSWNLVNERCVLRFLVFISPLDLRARGSNQLHFISEFRASLAYAHLHMRWLCFSEKTVRGGNVAGIFPRVLGFHSTRSPDRIYDRS